MDKLLIRCLCVAYVAILADLAGCTKPNAASTDSRRYTDPEVAEFVQLAQGTTYVGINILTHGECRAGEGHVFAHLTFIAEF